MVTLTINLILNFHYFCTNVTSAGWQVTLCDPMWHVSSSSSVTTLRTAIHLLLTYLLCFLQAGCCRPTNSVNALKANAICVMNTGLYMPHCPVDSLTAMHRLCRPFIKTALTYTDGISQQTDRQATSRIDMGI